MVANFDISNNKLSPIKIKKNILEVKKKDYQRKSNGKR